jgi:hypothetical protein
VYGNLRSENSQDYAQKPQQNCTLWIRLLYSNAKRKYFQTVIVVLKPFKRGIYPPLKGQRVILAFAACPDFCHSYHQQTFSFNFYILVKTFIEQRFRWEHVLTISSSTNNATSKKTSGYFATCGISHRPRTRIRIYWKQIHGFCIIKLGPLDT